MPPISNEKQEKFLGLDEFSPEGVKPEGVLSTSSG